MNKQSEQMKYILKHDFILLNILLNNVLLLKH